MRKFLSGLAIGLGILSAGLGVKGFLLPNGFIDGGVTGVCMLLSTFLRLPLPVFILIINLPFLIIGYRRIGRAFAVRAAGAILGFAVCLALLPFPEVSHDLLLGAVFGGVFLGAGIGLAVRGGGALDGTEILALVLSRRLTATVGDVILFFNILIFSTAALTLGIEPAMYSILTYVSASKTVDFILYGIEAYNGAIIISDQSHAIRDVILKELGRGVTMYKGSGGLSGRNKDILFCVATRLEIPKIKTIATSLDPGAVIFVHHVSEAAGGVIKKRGLP